MTTKPIIASPIGVVLFVNNKEKTLWGNYIQTSQKSVRCFLKAAFPRVSKIRFYPLRPFHGSFECHMGTPK